ncbi:MAG: hypothetical protein KC897_03695 [Candidatus Omnitrophica bacterium]|nr:hypothetical protein [Candidatus Omnitrophota bacterium]MCB9719476.1 hypothetical protein [Candidatus Omnitrophota bacterium]
MTDSFYYFMVTNEKDIFGGPHYGTQYDLSAACPVCGSGAVRQPPIYTKKLARSFDLYMTLDYDILFSDKLVAAFRDEEIDTFDDVISCKTKEILPYKVLRSQAELPRFSEKSKGFQREDPCSKCDQDGYFHIPHVPLQLHYRDVNPRLLEYDVLCTSEKFGRGRLREPISDSVFARPLYLVSDRFRRCLDSCKVKGYQVQLVEME